MLEHVPEPLELVVQLAQFRANGTKHGPSVASLGGMRVHLLTRCLQLYPQDAQLQRGGFEQIRLHLLSSSESARA